MSDPPAGVARLWAGWRSEYVTSTVDADGDDAEDACVFCRILASDAPAQETLLLARTDRAAAVLNAFPYTSGHLLVLPVRHVAELEDVTADESASLWALLADGVAALKEAYRPDGLNVGANIGRPAGAGVPGHFHVHCVPRWTGDTNFMTALAGTRVLPESLPASHEKLRAAWPTR